MVTAVTADSRTVGPGALFVALPGERADGHDYVAAARRGRRGRCADPASGRRSALCLVVADPLVALGRLARLPGRPGERWRAAGRRHHRFAGQDLDQGPASQVLEHGRPDGGAGGQPQQRARRAADRQPDR